MLECPNCGGNVKFDIPSQQIACEYCGTKVDPYSFENKTSDAEEVQDPENYEVTIFTCPQCGGEILSTDNAAAGFCSFCGASTILYSRISKEHRPDYIIPFKKTKDDCKQAFSNMMKKAIFAPKELKDPTKIDGFRGIYMPYWAFYETQRGPIKLKAEKSHRRGDYIYTDHYELTGNMDCYYKGLSYDASSSFADNISETIAPYDVKGMKAFTPAFLSGFYADTADVPSEVYRQEAEMIAYDQSVSQIKSEPAFRGYSIDSASFAQNSEKINTHTESVDQAMFPVWFMSYRNGDRVAYATVNGQTGKVVADLPVDMKRFLAGSLILAIPLFMILNLFFTVIPSVALSVTGVLAAISLIISCISITKIARRENDEEDRGILSKTDNGKPAELNRRSTKKEGKQKKTYSSVWVIMGLYLLVLLGLSASMIMTQMMGKGWIWIGILLTGFICAIIAFPKIGEVPGQKGRIGMIATLCGITLGTAITIWKPVSDLYYYAAIIVLIAGIFVAEKEIMEQYNLLATRRLPQFDKQGGDDRA